MTVAVGRRGEAVARCFDLAENWTFLWTRSAEGRHAHVDGLRALSVLWVIAMHVVFTLGLLLPKAALAELVRPLYMNPIIQGHHGVDVFFVVSGFLIGSLLMAEWKATGAIRYRRFYVRRALRLLPAYLVAIVMSAALIGENLGSVWANLVYVNNFLPAREQFMLWTWSLAIEEQFYLVCPLALALMLARDGRHRWPWLLAGLAASFLITALAVVHHGFRVPVAAHPTASPLVFYAIFDGLYGQTHTRFGGLLIGVGVAYLAHFTPAVAWLGRHRATARGALWGSLALLAGFLIFTPFKPSIATRVLGRLLLVADRQVLALAVGYVVLFGLTALASRSWTLRVLRHRAWYPIAQLSYSAYLIHIVVMLVGFRLLPLPSGSQASMLLYIPGFTLVTLALACLMFLLIERPFMRLRGGLGWGA